jgi:hypothetical protein
MMIRRPELNIIIAGDFNEKENPIHFLRNISGEDITFQRNNTRRPSKLDWILIKHIRRIRST